MSDAPSQTDESTTDPYVGVLVDFRDTARRVRRSALVIGTVVVIVWLGAGLFRGVIRLGDLAAFVLVGLGVMFVVEVVVVGGSALRGMLRAGERGERLSSEDVALVPPQLRKRGRS